MSPTAETASNKADPLTPSNQLQPTIVKARSGLQFLDFHEMWQYRELIYFLAWRDIKVRYKQTAIGVVWVILQPLALMAVFTLFFGRLANLPSDGVPYPLFALAGLIPWQMFSRTVSESTGSLITDQKLITRVYFPRILVPTATTLAALPDVIITFVILLIVMLFYGYAPDIKIFYLSGFLLLMIMTVLAAGFWLSALNVEYRDVMYVVPFLLQFWLFITPVVYASSLVPQQWDWLYSLNPMVVVIEGFRWSLLGAGEPSWTWLGSTATAALAFLTGIVWFNTRQRIFVDTIGSGGR